MSQLIFVGLQEPFSKGAPCIGHLFYFLHTFEGYFFKSSFCISFKKAIFSEKHQWVHLSQNLVHRTTQRRHFFLVKHQYIFRGKCLLTQQKYKFKIHFCCFCFEMGLVLQQSLQAWYLSEIWKYKSEKNMCYLFHYTRGVTPETDPLFAQIHKNLPLL